MQYQWLAWVWGAVSGSLGVKYTIYLTEPFQKPSSSWVTWSTWDQLACFWLPLLIPPIMLGKKQSPVPSYFKTASSRRLRTWSLLKTGGFGGLRITQATGGKEDANCECGGAEVAFFFPGMTWGITSSYQAQAGARAVWEMSTEHTARGLTSPSKLSGALHIETRIRTPGLSEGQATKQVGIEHSGVRRGRQINFQWQVGLREQIEIFGFLWVTWWG